MRLLILLLASALFIFSGKPAKDAKVILEDGAGKKVIAFQNVGEKGKVTFQGLDEADYRLLVVFPQQKGKWTRSSDKYRTLTKANYNPNTKTYFYQGDEGYFSVKFSGIKKIDSEDFKAVFREKRGDDETLIVISEFQTKRGGGQIALTVKAITPSAFKRSVEKIGNDISLFSIPKMR